MQAANVRYLLTNFGHVRRVSGPSEQFRNLHADGRPSHRVQPSATIPAAVENSWQAPADCGGRFGLCTVPALSMVGLHQALVAGRCVRRGGEGGPMRFLPGTRDPHCRGSVRCIVRGDPMWPLGVDTRIGPRASCTPCASTFPLLLAEVPDARAACVRRVQHCHRTRHSAQPTYATLTKVATGTRRVRSRTGQQAMTSP